MFSKLRQLAVQFENTPLSDANIFAVMLRRCFMLFVKIVLANAVSNEIVALHGKSLTTAGLPICENRSVVSLYPV